MTGKDLDELLGPIRDQWQCRRCSRRHPVPSLARDCELKDLEGET